MERARKSYLDGFGTGRLVLEHDVLTVREILESLDPEHPGDWTVSPWRRGYKAAIRSAFGR
jgi:hypothetical protein